MTHYCDVTSNRIEFRIRNDQGARTFDKEAVCGIFTEVSKFIASRLVRRWQHDPFNPPKILTIRLHVEIE